jgi:hypothetical protein
MDPHHLNQLKQSVDTLIETNNRLAKGVPLWRSFLNGIFSAFGATIGAAIVIAVIVGILRQLSVVDFFKPAIDQVLPLVDRTKQTYIPNEAYAPSPEVSISPSSQP